MNIRMDNLLPHVKMTLNFIDVDVLIMYNLRVYVIVCRYVVNLECVQNLEGVQIIRDTEVC